MLLILSRLPGETKRTALPLVCKRWARLCTEQSPLWERVTVDFSLAAAGGRRRPVRGAALTRWLSRRAPAVRSLALLRSEPLLGGSGGGQEQLLHDYLPVPVAGVKCLLATLCGGLAELRIEACNDLFLGNAWAAVGALTALTKLHCTRLRKSIVSHNIDAALGYARGGYRVWSVERSNKPAISE